MPDHLFAFRPWKAPAFQTHEANVGIPDGLSLPMLRAQGRSDRQGYPCQVRTQAPASPLHCRRAMLLHQQCDLSESLGQQLFLLVALLEMRMLLRRQKVLSLSDGRVQELAHRSCQTRDWTPTRDGPAASHCGTAARQQPRY